MEKVPGKRFNSSIFMDSETCQMYTCYKYGRRDARMYMKCAERNCTACGIYVAEFNRFITTYEHNHEPNKKAVDDRHLIAAIRTRLETEDVDPKIIYEEESIKYETPVQYGAIKQSMNRHRRRNFKDTSDTPRRRGRKRNPDVNLLMLGLMPAPKVPKIVPAIKMDKKETKEQRTMETREAREKRAMETSARETCARETMMRDAKEDDEFSYFANNIACQLRKLPITEALVIQRDMMDMLLSARQRLAMAAAVEASTNVNEDQIIAGNYEIYVEDVMPDIQDSETP